MCCSPHRRPRSEAAPNRCAVGKKHIIETTITNHVSITSITITTTMIHPSSITRITNIIEHGGLKRHRRDECPQNSGGWKCAEAGQNSDTSESRGFEECGRLRMSGQTQASHRSSAPAEWVPS